MRARCTVHVHIGKAGVAGVNANVDALLSSLLCMQWTCVESHTRAWRRVAQGQLPPCQHSPAWSHCIPTTCQGAQGDQVQSVAQTEFQPLGCPGRQECRAEPCKGPGSEEEWWDIQSGQTQQYCSGRVHQGEQMPKRLLCHFIGSLPVSMKFHGSARDLHAPYCLLHCHNDHDVLIFRRLTNTQAILSSLIVVSSSMSLLNSQTNLECNEHWTFCALHADSAAGHL